VRRVAPVVAAVAVAVAVALAAGPAQAAARSYDGLRNAPPMGFNDWNAYGCHVSAALIESDARYIHDSGMQKAGYRYVNIDDCWMASQRDAAGRLVANPATFPDGIAAVARYVHHLGLKLGIYEDAGLQTCDGYPGSWGHEATDAQTFAAWGVDYLKFDNCFIPYEAFPGLTHEQIDTGLWTNMSEALRATGRAIVFSMCNGFDSEAHPWRWGAPVSNLWRTTVDIQDNFASTLHNFQGNVDLWRHAHRGAFNDPDMLEIGNGGQTTTQYRSQFSLWSEMAAPLLAGTNLPRLTAADRRIYLNRAVIAVDQDRLGLQGRPVARRGGRWVLTKRLAGGDRAVVLFNATSRPAMIATTARAAGVRRAAAYRLTDLWSGARTRTAGRIAAYVPADGTAMYRVRGVSGPVPERPATPLSLVTSAQTVDTGHVVTVATTLADDGTAPLRDVRLGLTVPPGWRLASGHTRRSSPELDAGRALRARVTLRAPAGTAPLATVALHATAQFVPASGRPGTVRAADPLTLRSPVTAAWRIANATGEPVIAGVHGTSASVIAAGSGIVDDIPATGLPSDSFAAIVAPRAAGRVSVARVTVARQGGSRLQPVGMAGLAQRNDFAAAGSPGGVALTVDTAGHVVLAWNADGGRFVTQATIAATGVRLPVTLRLARDGSTYRGAYSTDGGRSWASAGTAVVAAAAGAPEQDVGVVHASGVAGWDTEADFSDFSLSSG
jgi:alpha-galactosidase